MSGLVRHVFERIETQTASRGAIWWMARLIALALIAGTVVFTWRGTLSVISADAWWFSDNFLRHYFEGQLGPLDFFMKRGALDHSQPVQKLLLLGYAQWFDLDFRIEAMAGLVFAVSFVLYMWTLVRSDVRGAPRATVAAELCLIGLAASVFSLNERGMFDWSLVTVGFLYPPGIALLLVAARHCLLRDRYVLLFLATFVATALMDTVVVLATSAVGVLIVFLAWRTRRWGAGVRALAAVILALASYFLAYAKLFPELTGGDPAPPKLAYLAEHAGEAWKAVVIPAGSVIFSANRVMETYGADKIWYFLIPSAILICLGHLLFWRAFLRLYDRRSAFVAAGLMLYFYAAVAGIVWGRVSSAGFDYLMQPRYLTAYSLQLVAFVMMGALAACYPRKAGEEGAALRYAGGVAMLAALAFYFLYKAQPLVPYLQVFDRNLALQTERLAQDPSHPPQDCLIYHLIICEWPLERRTAVLELLQRERLNVFSERFRAHLELPPPDRAAVPAH